MVVLSECCAAESDFHHNIALSRLEASAKRGARNRAERRGKTTPVLAAARPASECGAEGVVTSTAADGFSQETVDVTSEIKKRWMSPQNFSRLAFVLIFRW
jgi:hypothetical protein